MSEVETEIIVLKTVRTACREGAKDALENGWDTVAELYEARAKEFTNEIRRIRRRKVSASAPMGAGSE